MRALAAGLFAFVTLVGAASAQAWEAGTDGLVPIPPLSAHVTDVTQTLSAPERQALEAKLADWEARTGNQFAVLMVPSTQPEPIEAYAIRVADAWKIGRKGTDNGVLFVVAKNDRKLRLEVGYGFEGVLTDATSKRIIAETVAPKFREGAFGAGIDAGVDRVISVLAEGKPLPAAKARSQPASSGGSVPVMILVLVFIVVPAVGGVLKRIARQSRRLDRWFGSRRRGGVAVRRFDRHRRRRGDLCLHRHDLRRCRHGSPLRGTSRRRGVDSVRRRRLGRRWRRWQRWRRLVRRRRRLRRRRRVGRLVAGGPAPRKRISDALATTLAFFPAPRDRPRDRAPALSRGRARAHRARDRRGRAHAPRTGARRRRAGAAAGARARAAAAARPGARGVRAPAHLGHGGQLRRPRLHPAGRSRCRDRRRPRHPSRRRRGGVGSGLPDDGGGVSRRPLR